ADDPQAHARFRLIPSTEDVVEVRDARTLIAHLNGQQLRRDGALDAVLDPAAAAVLIGGARQLGDRRRNARLLGAVEPELRGNLPGALPRDDDVVLVVD